MSPETAGTALGTSSTTIGGSSAASFVIDAVISGCFNAPVVNRLPAATPCRVRGDCRQRGGRGGLGNLAGPGSG
jgi:hypothetical protein